jgi:hypothetical protein
MTLQELLQGKYNIVEYRGVSIDSFGDYVAGSEKFESEDELDLGGFCWDYEIDEEAPDDFLNKPLGGVVVKDQDGHRFVYVFK